MMKKAMKEVVFEDLGYFTESACKRIKKALEGATYMNFHIEWSNYAGNCVLIVATDADESKEDIRKMFLHAALGSL